MIATREKWLLLGLAALLLGVLAPLSMEFRWDNSFWLAELLLGGTGAWLGAAGQATRSKPATLFWVLWTLLGAVVALWCFVAFWVVAWESSSNFG